MVTEARMFLSSSTSAIVAMGLDLSYAKFRISISQPRLKRSRVTRFGRFQKVEARGAIAPRRVARHGPWRLLHAPAGADSGRIARKHGAAADAFGLRRGASGLSRAQANCTFRIS